MKELLIIFVFACAQCMGFNYSQQLHRGNFSFSGTEASNHPLIKAVYLEGDCIKCQLGWDSYPDELCIGFLNGAEIKQTLLLQNTWGYCLQEYAIEDITRDGDDGYIYIPRKDWEKAEKFELKVITK